MPATRFRHAATAIGLLVGSVGSAAAQTATAAAPPFPAADGVVVMIVFDGSGSMWARLDGERQAKFGTVRDALRPLLARVDPKIAIGLTTFGSRRRADCSDVAVAVPVAPGVERMTAVLDRFYPQGKSPLATALREAAKALPKGPGPRSLIVIHDDLDNCNADPCAALADVQAAAPGVVVHTIGVGLRPEDAQKLQCLTGPTRGRFIDAQTPATLASGLEEVLQAALSGTGPANERPVTAPALTRPAPVPAAASLLVAPGARMPLRSDGPSGVRLATVLALGQSPATRSANWVVRRAGAPPDAPPVFSGRGQDVLLPAAPGNYVVDVRDGFVRVMGVMFTVPDLGQVAVDVPLVAGLIRVPQPPEAASTEALITVFQSTDTLGVIPASEVEDGLAVPPGSLVVRLADGSARVDRTVDIRPGGITEVGSSWPFGRLQLTLAGSGVAPGGVTTVIVYEDDPDAPEGRREVTRSAAARPDFALPTGTYTLVAHAGSVEVRDRIVVQGGSIVRHTLALGGARLSLMTRLAGAMAGGAEEPVSYRVERLDAVQPQAFTAHRAMADMTIPAGRYRVEARYGLANARVMREVLLADGDTVALTLDHPAAVVTFVPPTRGVVVAWEVLSSDGAALWTSAQPRPRTVLMAGRYTVRLESRDRRLERTLEVRAGEPMSVDMPE